MMTLETKRILIAVLGAAFLGSLILVQGLEVARRREEAGLTKPKTIVPASSKECVGCHDKVTPGILAHWEGSTHAVKGVGCLDCHVAEPADVDAWSHFGATIATIVTPRDCGRCHPDAATEFAASHHSKAGNILASLDNLLAETFEGARQDFDPHAPTPGMTVKRVNGMAAANSGCQQCHGAKVAFESVDGPPITVTELAPDANGKPTNPAAVARIKRDDQGRPKFVTGTWPNTGIGRINLDGSLGSCAACHSRHDFSPRRARQPENCGKCHLGPDHPQKEIYEESKHGVAYRDLRDQMNLDAPKWILGETYAQAPTCASCHMSGNVRNGGKVTHDPGERLSWNNRFPLSRVMEDAPAKRGRMKEACSVCHAPSWTDAFYAQYDDLVVLYNEKFARPGQAIMDALLAQGMLTKAQFDEEIEWTWFYLWHHEGRRARHGAAMMAPDYTQWHGMFEVADRFYMHLIPEARALAEGAIKDGRTAQGQAVMKVVDEILARPEHAATGVGARRP